MDDHDLRVIFWNTWLLRPRLWRDGPVVPGGDRFFAPSVGERAPLVGAALAGRFDVAALAECFEPSEQSAVAHAWPQARATPGPQRGKHRFTGSGLLTLSDRTRVTVEHQARHTYRSGGDLRDSDTFASKGALLVKVRTDAALPAVEIVSTHLIAGGDLLPVPGANDHARHHRARMAQIDELVAFVQTHHDPAAVLLLVGDFNVAADDPDPLLATTQQRHLEMLEHLAPLGVSDLWAGHGVGHGHSCTFSNPAQLPPDPDEPDMVADLATEESSAAAAKVGGPERIDYLWAKIPACAGVSVGRPRRWAFAGRGVTGGPAGSLSDHLGLSVTLHFEQT